LREINYFGHKTKLF